MCVVGQRLVRFVRLHACPLCVGCVCLGAAGKLYLVDLAGSEKVRKTGASGILVRPTLLPLHLG